MAQSEPPPRFTVQSAHRNGVARVALQGELDLATVPLLAEHMGLVDDDGDGTGDGDGDWAGPTRVLLDLRGLTLMDSSGLRALLAAARDVSAHGHEFAAVGVNPTVRKVFELTGSVEFLNEARGLGLIERFTKADGDGAAR